MSNITVKIIQDSVAGGVRITTYELEYPRFIHAEFMTHRLFSRNAASSRAIPFVAMCDNIVNNTAVPIYWGKNQPGMSAKEEINQLAKTGAVGVWQAARDSAIAHATVLNDMGVHKQIVNRLTEPFSMIKTVLTLTERDNWYWLRDHKDAQPEIAELAKLMKQADDNSVPVPLNYGDWHVPYVHTERDAHGQIWYYHDLNVIDKATARMISASCCAQVSYRKNDDSIEKAVKVYERLIQSEPVHASPVEHQATPMLYAYSYMGQQNLEKGVTHIKRDGTLWSANFKGWIQFRQLIPNQSK